MRRGLLGLLCLVLLLRGAAWGGEPFEAVVTQPWLALLTSFIGGSNVTVVSLRNWGEGRVRRKALPAGARVMALDAGDAQAAGVGGPDLRCLYAPFPVKTDSLNAFLSDPSVLPFVAQRVLSVLSEWDPSNYPYYQRRLAEFQTRLSGSVLAGQQVLRDVPVLDLTAFSGPLLQAARCRITRPDLAALSRGSGLGELWETRGDRLIVIDEGTPKGIRKFLEGRPGVFLFERPLLTQDYPSFLHEQYLALWQKISLKGR